MGGTKNADALPQWRRELGEIFQHCHEQSGEMSQRVIQPDASDTEVQNEALVAARYLEADIAVIRKFVNSGTELSQPLTIPALREETRVTFQNFRARCDKVLSRIDDPSQDDHATLVAIADALTVMKIELVQLSRKAAKAAIPATKKRSLN
ncbi:MAG: hypothetical protein HY459_02955 [Parcubacteria group bacterium]|nr:hypothetical protein [Parcubacteria group bacterium]